ncbi:MAG: type II toxin-antitoxin system Phd/YefM family antitoxin [Candidatus Promineifilaceae bacterium]|jgi:PHD/YefM family antitoxin component YafN of YafNO toxin-antitoxin module
MPKVVSSTELQKNTREVIDWARIKGEAVVVETYGKPMAAILSFDEYEAYQQYKAARAARFARLRQAAAENSTLHNLTEEEAMALVELVRQDRHDEEQAAGRNAG